LRHTKGHRKGSKEKEREERGLTLSGQVREGKRKVEGLEKVVGETTFGRTQENSEKGGKQP